MRWEVKWEVGGREACPRKSDGKGRKEPGKMMWMRAGVDWTGGLVDCGRASVRRALGLGTWDWEGGTQMSWAQWFQPGWGTVYKFGELKVPCTLHYWRRSASTRVPFFSVLFDTGLQLPLAKQKMQPGSGGYLVGTRGYIMERAKAVRPSCVVAASAKHGGKEPETTPPPAPSNGDCLPPCWLRVAALNEQ